MSGLNYFGLDLRTARQLIIYHIYSHTHAYTEYEATLYWHSISYSSQSLEHTYIAPSSSIKISQFALVNKLGGLTCC